MDLFAEPRIVSRLEDCYFYHTLDLPGVGLVKGEWDLRDNFEDYIGRAPLAGKRVLDVGTASGFLTFEAEKRGAEVVSFDMADAGSQHLLPFRDKLYHTNRAAWVAQQTQILDRWKNGYWYAHRAYRSRARAHYGDIYDLPTGLGTFDVVVLGSVLEHLSDQVSALASCARLCADTLVLATPALMTEDRIASFHARADRPDADYTWWTYSVGTYKEVLAMLGFYLDRIVTTRLKFAGLEHPVERPTLVARRCPVGKCPLDLGARLSAARREGPRSPLARRMRSALGWAMQGLAGAAGRR